MSLYGSLCDDFYINMNLSTEMELPNNRETVLAYFERIQRQYPSMRSFFSREKGDFVLEDDEKTGGHYRWTSIETRRICSGVVNPPAVEDAMAQHNLVLEMAPAYLTVSPLDCEALDLLYGFDFNYRGNHNELISEALGLTPALERLLDVPGVSVVNYEPSITLALDDTCRTQCRLSIETRTTPFQIRSGEFPEDQISVYLTARQYGSLPGGMSFGDALGKLHQHCEELIGEYVIEHILRPLQRAIAIK